MNKHLVFTALTSCMLIPSCRVLNQRVDFSWFGDTMSPAQSDAVYVEAGHGLATTEPPTFLETEKRQNAVAAAPAMPAPPEPAAPATAPVPAKPVATVAPATPAAPAVAAAPKPPAPAPAAAPAAPAKPVAATHAARRTHTVAKGDTLAAIARRYHSSVPAICSANGIANPNALKLGTVLNIPDASGRVAAAAPVPHKAQKQQAARQAATPKRRFWQFWKKSPAATPATRSYTVRQGDTLNAIAHRHGVTPAALMGANGMSKEQANKLRIGQNIIIPATKK